MKRILTLLTIAIIQIGCVAQPYTLSSKKSNLTASLDDTDGKLTIEINEGKKAVLSKSPISLKLNDEEVKWELVSSKNSSTDKTLDMAYGEFSQVAASYTDMTCQVTLSTSTQNINGELTVRLFENAVAYQLSLDGIAKGTNLQEVSSYIPADLTGGYYSSNGEHEPRGPLAISELKKGIAPIIYKSGDKIIALNECGLKNYPQISFKGAEDGSSIDMTMHKVKVSGEFLSPWRVVMVGNDWVDLHNQKPIYQAMNDEPTGDFSWVKPGLCMWDWRVKGTTFNGFTYKMDTESLKRYIDFCSKSNIAYFLIDDEWFEKHDPLTPVKTLDLKAVIDYGKTKNVGIILYYDMTYVKDGVEPIPFDKVAQVYADLGVAGMKYGFLKAKNAQTKTNMTYNIIETAAKHKMILDFHDSPIPFSGLERTLPNYMNREYCHAQLDRRAAFNPRQFVKMACINHLAGHMDQTNGTYALNEMATRSKGPRNEYLSTVSAETARFVITHTGSFSVLIDAPEAYEEKADLFKVISTIPASWDETKYLEMDFDSHVAVAKRKADRWFTAVVYNENGGEHTLSLDFLEPKAKYTATIYRDADDADYKTNKEAYTIESKSVTAKDAITVKVPAGGGYSVIFDKQ
ncbi:MAG: glycoside hydrolase family 97 catalytic domain-containing protein [Rikenellaceae bacterium]